MDGRRLAFAGVVSEVSDGDGSGQEARLERGQALDRTLCEQALPQGVRVQCGQLQVLQDQQHTVMGIYKKGKMEEERFFK